ncbi:MULTISPECIES: type I 3-dehydroquinate dehydratase [Acinetobacter calcoaceticus/baumannii complex]|uniref:type I 3-dehydroquinate dehydratase n=1 Tax=Acinetobacter calcoaceticus/baumannii complex TaxID=909768 RepID=UPI000A33D5F5|nr:MULTISPECIES: type I 3-dehydroquinate dehydratase [Acinetobacter calcoaceticus/baumannii complex]EHU1236044.1 type I 3-dehydroquinate dehydratase [Acinetobacter baumannii]EHU1492123.1 type I 3-dehydroquinate dehydratase [Acinetobacter baumannii]EHU1569356.1 type I 3-dehydroquinate dehydratase [Acinetobacter baumannii]EHU1625913.1 type I 3-dehydroquinate dehydratase [Acinetobacter baumannii]EHU1650478.1 type I 3-dehydroquinate dehydratase [Acinetobacter baumannii]
MKTLLSLSLLALPFFAAQANAEPVTLNAQTQPAATAVKTIVPITAKTKEQALAQAQVIANTADADLAEFRIDLLSFASDTKQVIALGHELKKILGNKPMIATIRTKNEGGQLEISDADYGKTYQAYLKNPFMDWLDVEMFRDQKVVSEIVQKAHQKKVLVVMSNHDFQKTPSQDEIEKRLLKQDQMGADVLKIAVMPKSKQDVFTLMNATLKVSQQTTKPLLTMSMGQLGTISRVATANMGGSYSFGMIGQASAPGQIDVTKLKQILQTVQPTNP